MAAPAAAQLPPDAPWRTLESTHLRVTYPGDDPRMEPLARHAAARGEVAWRLLEQAVGRPPAGKVDIVLTDAVDYSNGSATPYPTNRIVVHARPPAGDPALGYNGDWIELVVVHELAHIFHLDRTGPLGEVARAVFGRLPYTWPVFPAVGSPRWATEGLAVLVESDATGLGRLHGSWHEMIVRTAVLEGGLPPLDRVTSAWAGWPGGDTPYVFGSLFLDFLRSRHGEAAIPALVDATAASALPPELVLDRLASRAAGESFSAAWRAWSAELAIRYAALRDTLEARGLTEGLSATERGRLTGGERLTTHGRWALHPRFSPDGGAVAYMAEDGLSPLSIRVVQSATGELLWEGRRNGQGAAAWLPDGSGLLTAQLEYADRYRIHADLWTLGPAAPERRLTRDARLQAPDVARDGRIVAVREGGGTNHLVVGTPAAFRALTEPSPDVHWSAPRWAPAGDAVAAVRWQTGGAHDLVVLDSAGAIGLTVPGQGAMLGGPAWSPDGRWLLFTSDRTGITNVHAVPAGGGEERQVTEVLGGAFHPDVSPDGRWLVYAEYHADGFHLVRIPFDPQTWRTPRAAVPPLRNPPASAFASAGREPGSPPGSPPGSAVLPGADTPPAGVLAADTAGDLPGVAAQDTVAGASRPYRPLASALPAFWSPAVLSGDRMGTFLGAALAGTDLVGRHQWSAWAAVNPADGLWQGAAHWSWAGLGQPVLTLSASREWDWLGRVTLPDGGVREVVAREDEVALVAGVLRPRWRSSLTLAAGPELVRRHRVLEEAGGHTLRDTDDRLWGALVRAGYADYQSHPLGISRQDGVSAGALLRHRWDGERGDGREDGYGELLGSAAAYLTLGRVGFSEAVLALRGSGLYRDGEGARPTGVGGASGDLTVGTAGLSSEGSRLLPVRGFRDGDRSGTRAWTGSAELRLPLALVGRGAWLLPLFLDRMSATLFADAGGADCPGLESLPGCGPPGALASVGGELVTDLVVGFRTPLRLRLGAALPLRGPGSGPVFHLRVGPSF